MLRPSFDDPVRVLIIDDSAVIRGFVSRALSTLSEVAIVGSCPDGQAGINFALREIVDIIILDIEMPVKDGLTALPELVKAAPGARILMSSTLTLQGAEISMRALSLGAADYVTKPSTRDNNATQEWQRDLSEKVMALGEAAWRDRHAKGKIGPLPASTMRASRAVTATAGGATPSAAPLSNAAPSRLYEGTTINTIAQGRDTPEVIAIGSSTGGPQALFTVLPALKDLRQPIVITQHMPPNFTTILADHISKQTGVPCSEAKNGDVLEPGKAFVAPGDYHMLIERQGTKLVVKLDQGPQENYCRPSVEPMLRSLISAVGATKITTAILTGMGSDGLKGCKLVAEGGGTVIGQDQATSVVWGMPGAVATAGICAAVLPLTEVGPWLRRKATGGRE
jgi:two-component system chemotaxis response regulator CheB